MQVIAEQHKCKALVSTDKLPKLTSKRYMSSSASGS